MKKHPERCRSCFNRLTEEPHGERPSDLCHECTTCGSKFHGRCWDAADACIRCGGLRYIQFRPTSTIDRRKTVRRPSTSLGATRTVCLHTGSNHQFYQSGPKTIRSACQYFMASVWNASFILVFICLAGLISLQWNGYHSFDVFQFDSQASPDQLRSLLLEMGFGHAVIAASLMAWLFFESVTNKALRSLQRLLATLSLAIYSILTIYGTNPWPDLFDTGTQALTPHFGQSLTSVVPAATAMIVMLCLFQSIRIQYKPSGLAPIYPGMEMLAAGRYTVSSIVVGTLALIPVLAALPAHVDLSMVDQATKRMVILGCVLVFMCYGTRKGEFGSRITQIIRPVGFGIGGLFLLFTFTDAPPSEAELRVMAAVFVLVLIGSPLFATLNTAPYSYDTSLPPQEKPTEKTPDPSKSKS